MLNSIFPGLSPGCFEAQEREGQVRTIVNNCVLQECALCLGRLEEGTESLQV